MLAVRLRQGASSLAALVLLGVGTVSSSGDSSGPGSTLPVVFRDVSGSEALAIQTDVTRPDVGRFDFRVYGTGYAIGVIPVQLVGNVETINGTVAGQLYDESGAAVRAVQVKMEGEANPTDGSASINVWLDSQHYHLGTAHGDLNDGAVAGSEALSAIASEDWTSVYYMLTSDIQAQLTLAQFVQAMSSQTAPKVLSASIVPPGTISTIGGFSYLTIPYTAQLQNGDGSTSTLNQSIYMVLDGGSWHLLTTGPSSLN